MLLFLFYAKPGDCLQVLAAVGRDDQVLAAQTLVNRGLVFHKPSRTWYRRESSGGNYGTIACREKFQVSSWAFVPCSENVKMMEVLSPGEVNDCLKQLSQ